MSLNGDLEALQHVVDAALASLEANRARIDDLNVYPVPDGDTGTNLTMTVRAMDEAVDSTSAANRQSLARDVARGALMGARGNSGVIFSQIVRGISQGRKLPEEIVRAMVDRAPLLAKEALAARLVDGLGYRDEVVRKALAKAGAGTDLTPLARYMRRIGRAAAGRRLALIYGVGEVTRGRGVENPLLGTVTMGSESVAAAFRTAAADSDVRAIVFRVDSPGGSYVASDTIETPEEIAETIGRALQFVPKERLIACTNCGLAPMRREIAEAKLKALAKGAALAAERYR